MDTCKTWRKRPWLLRPGQNPIHSARSYRLAAPALNQTTGIRNWTLPERLQSGSLLHVILTFPIGLVGTIQIRLTASLGMPFLRQ